MLPRSRSSVWCGSEAISAPRRPIRKRGSSRPPCWRSGSVRARSPARIRIARGPSPERRLSGSGTVDGRPGGVAELVLSESQCVRRGLPLFERADVCWLEDGDGSGAPRRSRREGGRRPNSAASRPSKPWSGLAPTWPPHCTCSRASSTTRAGLVDQLGVGGRRNVISPDDIDRLPAARRLAEWRGLTTDTVESVTVAPADSREWDAGRIDVRFLGTVARGRSGLPRSLGFAPPTRVVSTRTQRVVDARAGAPMSWPTHRGLNAPGQDRVGTGRDR